MGYTEAESKETVRVSMGWNTTREEVDRFLAALPAIVERLRRSTATVVS
jgi:cysteine desulfurase